VIDLEERQLLTQPRFVFAHRGDPPPNRRHRLAQVQMQALDKGRIALPAPLGQDGLDGLGRAEDDAVGDPDNAPAPVPLDHLRLAQPG
jgi:hypothetical protein